HTRCLSDWSSDVCSSDLGGGLSPSPPGGTERNHLGSGRDRRSVAWGAGRAFLSRLLWALLLPAVVHFLWRVPVVCAIASVEHRCLSRKCRGAAAHRRTDSFRVAPGAYGGARGFRILPRGADGLV